MLSPGGCHFCKHVPARPPLSVTLVTTWVAFRWYLRGRSPAHPRPPQGKASSSNGPGKIPLVTVSRLSPSVSFSIWLSVLQHVLTRTERRIQRRPRSFRTRRWDDFLPAPTLHPSTHQLGLPWLQLLGVLGGNVVVCAPYPLFPRVCSFGEGLQ